MLGDRHALGVHHATLAVRQPRRVLSLLGELIRWGHPRHAGYRIDWVVRIDNC